PERDVHDALGTFVVDAADGTLWRTLPAARAREDRLGSGEEPDPPGGGLDQGSSECCRESSRPGDRLGRRGIGLARANAGPAGRRDKCFPRRATTTATTECARAEVTATTVEIIDGFERTDLLDNRPGVSVCVLLTSWPCWYHGVRGAFKCGHA